MKDIKYIVDIGAEKSLVEFTDSAKIVIVESTDLIEHLNKQFSLNIVVRQSEQLRFLIDKFQTPKGNYLIELLMAEKERKDKKP